MRPFQIILRPEPTLQRAERVGFEPTVAQHHTAFRERHLQPLGHLSSERVYQFMNVAGHAPALVSAYSLPVGMKKPPGVIRAVYLVRLAGFEPAAFGSATQRSIP